MGHLWECPQSEYLLYDKEKSWSISEVWFLSEEQDQGFKTWEKGQIQGVLTMLKVS
jgi:hypothetical protein